jgi:hypothetical protein
MTVFGCADGVVRLFLATRPCRPHGTRDPLYCWEIDPDPKREFARAIGARFSSVTAKLPIRSGAGEADFCDVPLHANATVAFGVSTR